MSHFFLVCDTGYGYKNAISNKLHNFQMLCDTIQRTLINRTRKDARIMIHKVIATSTFSDGNITWTMTTRANKQTQSAKIKFSRKIN